MYNSLSLDDQQQLTSAAVVMHLTAATDYINRKSFADARDSTNHAASEIRRLQRIHSIRRGTPRQDLDLEIHYLAIWQVIVVGYKLMITTDGNSHTGRELCEREQRLITALIITHPNVPKYIALSKLIESWLAPFKDSQNQWLPVVER